MTTENDDTEFEEDKVEELLEGTTDEELLEGITDEKEDVATLETCETLDEEVNVEDTCSEDTVGPFPVMPDSMKNKV